MIGRKLAAQMCGQLFYALARLGGNPYLSKTKISEKITHLSPPAPIN
jgi:hypothetical protein